VNLRKDHYRAKKRLSLRHLESRHGVAPRQARPDRSVFGHGVGRRLSSRTRLPFSSRPKQPTRLSDASKGGTELLRCERQFGRRLALLNYLTNGILLASTPVPSVTVAFPSTVMMARRKFPPPFGAEVEQTQ